MPAEIGGRAELVFRFQSMASALRGLQNENGEWHTVLNHPETYLEHSIACFVCAALLKGMRTGLLEASFGECALRSWNALTGSISKSGEILVSEATPEGDLALYQSLSLGVFPWGQGAALRAIAERMRSEFAAGK